MNKKILKALLLSFSILWGPLTAGAAKTCQSRLVRPVESVSYGGVQFDLITLSGRGFRLTPQSVEVSSSVLESPVIRSVGRRWDISEFQTPRAPVLIGRIENKSLFSQSGAVRVLDMPIKFPESREVLVPEELQQFREAIQTIINFESSINKDFVSDYAYLTVDQKIVEPRESHRSPGPHVDGIQGRSYPTKLRIDHSYLISDLDPTLFFRNRFDLSGYDVEVHNLNKAFAAQAEHATAIRPLPYEIVMMDAFTVHESPLLSRGGLRTLFRLEFSEKKFDRLGNTHNPLFRYSWEMVPKPIPSDLK